MAERATSPSARVRRQAARVAAELLPALGLDEGRYGPDGTRAGGSPDFEAVAAALPADARAAVAVLGLVADPALLPSGLPTTGRAVGKVLLSGVAAAIGAAGTAAVVGAATGDVAKVVTAGITGGAALVGQAAALRADRAYGRLTELLRAAADVRRGLPPDALAVHDRAVAEALDAVARDRADAVATRAALDRLAELAGRQAGTAPGGARTRLAERLAGITAPATAGRRDRTTSDGTRADQLAVPADVRPDATPSRRAWATKAVQGPAAAAVVAAVGLGVASSLGVAISLTVAGGLVAGLATVGLTTVVEHAQARHKATLDTRRTAVEEARRAARAAAEQDARAAAGRALDAGIAADLRQAERTAARLDALAADAAAGRPATAPDPERPPAGAAVARPTGDQLVPGPRNGPVDPAALTDGDRARLADLTRALDDVRSARGRARTAAVARAREVAAALGLDAPLDTGLRTDPDQLGWPHRRAVLDEDLQLRLAAIDELPSAVPAPGWAVAKGLAGAALPSATAAVLGVATLGVAPAVALAVAPVALTVSSALGERAAAVTKERGKRPSSLWSSAADEGLADADARRAADRAGAVAALAEQQAENRRRADELERRDRARDRRRPRTVVPSAPPVPVAPVDADEQATGTAPRAEPSGGRPRYPVAVARAFVPAAAVVGGAVAVFAAATDLSPAVLVQPGTWDTLGAAAVPVLAGSIGAAVAGLASLASATGDAAAGKSAFDREGARGKATEARRARWTRIERAAVDAALEDARQQVDADLAGARADLAEARAQLDAARARSRRPRLLQLVLDRAAALVAAVESAVGRLTRDAVSPDALTSAADTALLDTAPLDTAVLAREAEQLRTTAPDARADRVREVLDGARRLGLLDPGPDAARRRLAVPGPLAAVAAAFVGSAAAVGPVVQDEQFWRWVRTVANATGWWPEEMCDCPPGTSCTCAVPAPTSTGPSAPAGPTTPAGPTPPAEPAVPPASAAPSGPAVPGGPPVARPSPTPQTPSTQTPSTQAPSIQDPATPVPPVSAVPDQGRRPAPPLPYSPRPTPPGAQQSPPAPPAAEPGRPVVDVEQWPDGPGRTSATVVTVVAPGGARVDLLVRWVDPGAGQRPVLVLSDLPGSTFWWGVPVAVQEAAALALAALRPPVARVAAAVVLGERGSRPSVLSELPVTLGGPRPGLVPGRGPRQLDPAETGAAVAALRLRPVADLLGRLRQVPAGR